ncbi:hypothetical protein HF209_30690 [Pseudomonas sp. WS 5096]|uniref:Uncharacterized protein n=1 Tax=Pseudomonas cremoris TaxID=2724178 RepID=A0ABR6TH70_9PSED|nr:hypothetical protein [Pseudomonas cremoris]MBC2385326.1 hypothetical protein [Pseudomonas cremoris]
MHGSEPVVKQCVEIITSAKSQEERLEAANILIALIEILPYNILTSLQEISGVALSIDERDIAKNEAFAFVGAEPTMLMQVERWKRSPELFAFGTGVERALTLSIEERTGA